MTASGSPASIPAKAGELFDAAGYSSFGPDGIRKNAKGDRLSFELAVPVAQPHRTAVGAEGGSEEGGAGDPAQAHAAGSLHRGAWRRSSRPGGEGCPRASTTTTGSISTPSNADKTQTNNFWGYADKEMDKLLDAFRSESDLEKKAALDRQIQRKVDEAALVIPNYYVPYFRGSRLEMDPIPCLALPEVLRRLLRPLRKHHGLRGLLLGRQRHQEGGDRCAEGRQGHSARASSRTRRTKKQGDDGTLG